MKCGVKIDDNAKFCHQCGQVSANEQNIYNPASMGKRFLNFLIDSIAFMFLSFIIGAVISVGMRGEMGDLSARMFGLAMSFVLYVLFESVWQKTPGKFVTKTKVVTYEGEKPELSRIMGRTLARWMPFEALSFLTRSNPVGWHDKLSKTMVVPAEYSEDDVRNIDKSKIEKTKIWFVVIVIVLGGFVIIGLLSTLAVVALNSARVKARDSKRMSDVKIIEMSLELYRLDVGRYPDALIPGRKLDYNGKSYLGEVPRNPLPSGEKCPKNFEYEYSSLEGGNSYELKYCLEGGFENEGSGLKTIHPNE